MTCFVMDFTFMSLSRAGSTEAVEGMKARMTGDDGSGNGGKMEQRGIRRY